MGDQPFSDWDWEIKQGGENVKKICIVHLQCRIRLAAFRSLICDTKWSHTIARKGDFSVVVFPSSEILRGSQFILSDQVAFVT